jgi:hypothetical protein
MRLDQAESPSLGRKLGEKVRVSTDDSQLRDGAAKAAAGESLFAGYD